jgi:hypothetical protein
MTFAGADLADDQRIAALGDELQRAVELFRLVEERKSDTANSPLRLARRVSPLPAQKAKQI